jgi:glucose/mannose-6-phosphate isomerase
MKFMLAETIRNIPEQFVFEPFIENEGKLKSRKKFLVCGMGGSQLAADILKAADPAQDISGWRDYGLPQLADIKDRLVVLSSYSGNTEEVLDAFVVARAAGLSMAVLAKGGKLIELARKEKTPHVVIPDTGIQPRQASGFMLRGLLALLGDKKGLAETHALAAALKPADIEEEGARLAGKLRDRVPVIYASSRNEALARNWKIKFNENGKAPAFWNVFPELNHNEMTGFEAAKKTKPLAKGFHFVFLEDSEDHPQIIKRMAVTKDLFAKRGLRSDSARLKGDTRYQRIFGNLLLAEWASYHTAILYGTEPEEVPMVEEFKKLI